MRVRFSISVADLFSMFGSHRELMKNGSVEVKLADGSQFSERGTIELLNNEANARTDTIQIYVSFPNEERKLVMGNTLTVTLFRANGKMLPAVTPSALMHDSNGSWHCSSPTSFWSRNTRAGRFRFPSCSQSPSPCSALCSGCSLPEKL